MSYSVTLVVTSCGRLDLLEKTLKSFFQFNTYPITKTLIIEDSGKRLDFTPIEKCIIGPYEIIKNETNIGQIKSIDKVYSMVQTDYIFHCEDDWEFHQPGFIEKSYEILQTDPKIFTVWLRGYHEKKVQKLLNLDNKVQLESGDCYYKLKPAKPWQTGFTLNPGLRRTSDCMILHPYDKLPLIYIKHGLDIIGEKDLSVHHGELGFGAAITSNKTGYLRHIGDHRHVLLPWEKQ